MDWILARPAVEPRILVGDLLGDSADSPDIVTIRLVRGEWGVILFRLSCLSKVCLELLAPGSWTALVGDAPVAKSTTETSCYTSQDPSHRRTP